MGSIAGFNGAHGWIYIQKVGFFDETWRSSTHEGYFHEKLADQCRSVLWRCYVGASYDKCTYEWTGMQATPYNVCTRPMMPVLMLASLCMPNCVGVLGVQAPRSAKGI